MDIAAKAQGQLLSHTDGRGRMEGRESDAADAMRQQSGPQQLHVPLRDVPRHAGSRLPSQRLLWNDQSVSEESEAVVSFALFDSVRSFARSHLTRRLTALRTTSRSARKSALAYSNA